MNLNHRAGLIARESEQFDVAVCTVPGAEQNPAQLRWKIPLRIPEPHACSAGMRGARLEGQHKGRRLLVNLWRQLAACIVQ
jgi:hypothetical protein